MSNLPDLYIDHNKAPVAPPQGASYQAGPNQGPATGTYGFEPDDDQLDLRYLLGTFARQRKLFFLVFAAIFGLVVAFTLLQTPHYSATTEVALSTRDKSSGPELLDMSNDLPKGDADISTELRVLYSRNLAEAVYDKVNSSQDAVLSTDLEAGSGPMDLAKSYLNAGVTFINRQIALIGLFAPKTLSPEEIEQEKSQHIDQFLKGLNVRRIGNAHAVAISYAHPDAETAAKVADEYARAYVYDQLKYKRETNRRAAEFMEKRIDELGAQSQDASQRALQYRIENGLLSESGSSLDEQNIAALNRELAQARADLAEAEARYKTATTMISKGSKGDDFTEALSSDVIKNLRTQQAAVTGKLAELSVDLGSRHPTILQTRQELRDVNRQIQSEIDRLVANLKNEVQGLEERVNSLSDSVAASRTQLADKNRALVQFEELDRQSETSRILYENYLNSYKETVAREGIEQADARILSHALVPTSPSSPNIKLNLAFGLALAFAAASAVAFIAEMNYPGLTLGRDVETKLRLPNLGIVPTYTRGKVRKKTMEKSLSGKKASVLGESVSNILTSVQFMSGSGTQVIYVTSSFPNEGKSTLSALIALVASRKGAKTIAVDCDRFKGGLTRLLKSAKEPGLAEYLTGKKGLDELVQHGVYNENSSFLGVGNTKLSDGRVEEDHSFPALVQKLRQDYDLIVLDGPPLLPIAEAREIAALADYTIMAAKWRSTPRDAISEAIRKLPHHVQAKLGVVLTQVDLKAMKRIGVGDSYHYYAKHITDYIG